MIPLWHSLRDDLGRLATPKPPPTNVRQQSSSIGGCADEYVDNELGKITRSIDNSRRSPKPLPGNRFLQDNKFSSSKY